MTTGMASTLQSGPAAQIFSGCGQEHNTVLSNTDSAGCLLLSCVQVGQIEVITFKSLGSEQSFLKKLILLF